MRIYACYTPRVPRLHKPKYTTHTTHVYLCGIARLCVNVSAIFTCVCPALVDSHHIHANIALRTRVISGDVKRDGYNIVIIIIIIVLHPIKIGNICGRNISPGRTTQAGCTTNDK